MTPKQTAFTAVAKLAGLSVAYAFGMALLIYLLPLKIIGILASLGLIFYLLKVLYELELDKAEQSTKLVDKPQE